MTWLAKFNIVKIKAVHAKHYIGNMNEWMAKLAVPISIWKFNIFRATCLTRAVFGVNYIATFIALF
jgi:hypothetical protein